MLADFVLLVIPNLGLGLADSFAGSLEVGAGHHHFLHRLILIARSVGESYGEGRGVEFDDLNIYLGFAGLEIGQEDSPLIKRGEFSDIDPWGVGELPRGRNDETRRRVRCITRSGCGEFFVLGKSR